MTIKRHDKTAPNLRELAAAVAEFDREVWREHYSPFVGAEAVGYMLEKFRSAERIFAEISEGGFVYFTAETGPGVISGYCSAVPKEGYALLSKLYVRKSERGAGLARRFLGEVTALCGGEYGLPAIRLMVNRRNETSIAVYERLGFAKIGELDTDIGGGYSMDDYVMELVLKN